jgi:crotonobetainyl-CoA:carnitine CoA-transferase CaiB-like acyl-CoA transferase
MARQAPSPTADHSPLDGLGVADFSRVLAGPLCTMVLADLGADVIKVERPTVGDDTREWGPPFLGQDATYFLALNRNKRSIALDLDDASDRSVARALALKADVVVENFREGVMTRFGLDYPSLRQDNPALIYCSIPAFASGDARRAGYDLLMQAASGLMSITGEANREPVKVGVAILDVVAGLFAAVGILASLEARGRTGRGQHVRVGLFEASVASLVNQAAGFLMAGVVPRATGNVHPSIVPYQAFGASDGSFVLAAGNDKLFLAMCDAMGLPELAADPSFATNADRVRNRAALVGRLQSVFSGYTTAELLERLEAVGVPASPIRGIDDVFASPEGAEMVEEIDDPVRGVLRLLRSPIELSEMKFRSSRRPPPILDEHGEDVRQWLGVEASELHLPKADDADSTRR